MSGEIELRGIELQKGNVILPCGSAYLSIDESDLNIAAGDLVSAVNRIVPKLRATEVLILAIPNQIDVANIKSQVCTVCRLVRSSDRLKTDERRIFQGVCRARLVSYSGGIAKAVLIEESREAFPVSLADSLRLAAELLRYDEVMSVFISRALALAESTISPSLFVDALASGMPLSTEERLLLLNETSTVARCRLLLSMLVTKIKPPLREKILKSGRADSTKALINPSKLLIRQIPKSSGSPSRDSKADAKTAEDEDDMGEVLGKLKEANLSDEGRKVVDREIRRLRRMSPQSAEYQVTRTYLETLADIPWNNLDNPKLDHDAIKLTRKYLDEDHYGLEKPKARLIEHVAVTYLRQRQDASQRGDTTAPIILLVGPPGVGKTSLAKSVARALGKHLYRISLGGVRDEAEIRGHRRTYIGAMPGVFVQGLRKAGAMNPVLVLDEIDKVGQGVTSVHGDPAAALLEVLDPSQNSSFVDHYVGFPLDLSQVTFIATANSVDTIPAPLLDRMEVIQVEGYTYIEKATIAQRYLLPKQLRATALAPNQLEVEEAALRRIITEYTRESGVRSLERQLGALARGWAVQMLSQGDDTTKHKIVTAEEVPQFLGLPRYHDDVINDKVDEYLENGHTKIRAAPGLVNGLAYMGSGLGGILAFEASLVPNGSGKLELTGTLGRVISESAQIALTWVRSNATKIGIDSELFTTHDIHLHAPAGAIPKDGPSAGVAMTVCFVSLLTGRIVPRDLAMTGEITLRGKILPVGGIREKLLGAHLAGIQKVILPWHVRNVVEEEAGFAQELGIVVVYAKYIGDVFAEIWPEQQLLQASQL